MEGHADFKKDLINLQKVYKTQSQYANRDNVLTISQNDFNSLSAFEKRTIQIVTTICNLIN